MRRLRGDDGVPERGELRRSVADAPSGISHHVGGSPMSHATNRGFKVRADVEDGPPGVGVVGPGRPCWEIACADRRGDPLPSRAFGPPLAPSLARGVTHARSASVRLVPAWLASLVVPRLPAARASVVIGVGHVLAAPCSPTPGPLRLWFRDTRGVGHDRASEGVPPLG